MLKLAYKNENKRRCHRCHGSGQADCMICHGQGRVVTGRDQYSAPVFGRCEGCMGRKTNRCTVCRGDGWT